MSDPKQDGAPDEPDGGYPLVDALGLLCPLPIVHTARRLKALPAGAIVDVRSDDPGICTDLPAWCRAMGHELLSLEEIGGAWRGRVRKGPGIEPT